MSKESNMLQNSAAKRFLFTKRMVPLRLVMQDLCIYTCEQRNNYGMISLNIAWEQTLHVKTPDLPINKD